MTDVFFSVVPYILMTALVLSLWPIIHEEIVVVRCRLDILRELRKWPDRVEELVQLQKEVQDEINTFYAGVLKEGTFRYPQEMKKLLSVKAQLHFLREVQG